MPRLLKVGDRCTHKDDPNKVDPWIYVIVEVLENKCRVKNPKTNTAYSGEHPIASFIYAGPVILFEIITEKMLEKT